MIWKFKKAFKMINYLKILLKKTKFKMNNRKIQIN